VHRHTASSCTGWLSRHVAQTCNLLCCRDFFHVSSPCDSGLPLACTSDPAHLKLPSLLGWRTSIFRLAHSPGFVLVHLHLFCRCGLALTDHDIPGCCGRWGLLFPLICCLLHRALLIMLSGQGLGCLRHHLLILNARQPFLKALFTAYYDFNMPASLFRQLLGVLLMLRSCRALFTFSQPIVNRNLPFLPSRSAGSSPVAFKSPFSHSHELQRTAPELAARVGSRTMTHAPPH
jgi:hypothetical protein